MSTNLVIIGSGGDARETLDIVEAGNRAGTSDYKVVGFIVEEKYGKPGRLIGELPILGDFAWFAGRGEQVEAVCAVGSPALRQRLVSRAAQYNIKFANVIHPGAFISPSVQLGTGIIIGPGCIVTNQTRFGDHTHINVACTIAHNNVLEDFVTLSPGVHTGGNVWLQEGCFLGLGAIVIETRQVGKWAVVGAGSVVIRDVPDRVTVAGVPARPLASQPTSNWITQSGGD